MRCPEFEITQVIRVNMKGPKKFVVLISCEKCRLLVERGLVHTEEECVVAQIMGS